MKARGKRVTLINFSAFNDQSIIIYLSEKLRYRLKLKMANSPQMYQSTIPYQYPKIMRATKIFQLSIIKVCGLYVSDSPSPRKVTFELDYFDPEE